MLRPSYTELMEKLNREQDMDNKITSRYTIVIASAKRARQIIDGASPQTYAPTDRAVSIAIKEMYEGKLHIKSSDEDGAGVLGTFQYGDDEAPGGYQHKLKYTMLRDEKERDEIFDLGMDADEDEFQEDQVYDDAPVYNDKLTKDEYEDFDAEEMDYEDEAEIDELETDEEQEPDLEDDYS